MFARKSPFLLRCFAEQRSNCWVAVCVDLNLAAQADSYEAVRQKLDVIVEDYVREAFTVDREHVEDLLNQRAPLELRMRYHLISAVCAVKNVGRALSHKAASKNVRQLRFYEPAVPACTFA